MPERSFKDLGFHLSHFSTEFIVVCPRCSASARVQERWNESHQHWMPATVACTSCGYTQRSDDVSQCERCPKTKGAVWQGTRTIYAEARCRECGRRLSLRRRTKHRPRFPIDLTCECGTITSTSTYSVRRDYSGLNDPCFGLPLRLQTPCAGNVLWAYNPEHLAYLKDFLEAKLRLRGPNDHERGGPYSGTIIAELPRWLKAAKHREEALRAVVRLERLLIG